MGQGGPDSCCFAGAQNQAIPSSECPSGAAKASTESEGAMSRQLQHDGKRSKRSPVWSGEADGASGITMNASNEPQDQRLYIIRGHPEDGDYLRAIEHNEWA